jgi:DNA-binding SARP family transcriptional activator
MAERKRNIAIVGPLGVFPMVRLALHGRRLLAYLALKGPAVTRAIAAAELWPDVPDDTARANLRRALWHLPAGWVASTNHDLLLQAESDLAHATQAAARAMRGEPLTLDDITLLSNDILPGWHEEWLVAAQDSFRLLRLQALEAACRTMVTTGQLALATQAGAAALAADPLCESAAEALIDAHLAQRNRHLAAQCFNNLSSRLRRELGVAPDPALAKRLAQFGIAGRRAG